MIRFSCYCGHEFVLEDSRAAGTVQCPDCRKLNDVPTLADLEHLDETGGIQLKPTEIVQEPERLEVLSRVYHKGRQDASGQDIDLRHTPEEFARRGMPAAREPQERRRPYYDPETGQLIRPMDVAPPLLRKAGPVARPLLRYVKREVPRSELLGVGQLGRPVNLFTMGFVSALVFFAGLMAFLVLIPFPNLKGADGPPTHMLGWAGPLVILELLVFSHYGHVIEDLGPLNRDELPRMFGDVMFYENIFAPLRAVVLSVLLCYLPAVAAFNLPMPTLAVVLGSLLTGAGTYFFPAVLLILTTSQAIQNLRPDRLIATIHACGIPYFLCVGSWLMAGGIYLLALMHFLAPVLGQLQPIVDGMPDYLTMLLAVPVLHVLTVFPAHVFAWQTGMLYRRSYADFAWVGQRHQKKSAIEKNLQMKAD